MSLQGSLPFPTLPFRQNLVGLSSFFNKSENPSEAAAYWVVPVTVKFFCVKEEPDPGLCTTPAPGSRHWPRAGGLGHFISFKDGDIPALEG